MRLAIAMCAVLAGLAIVSGSTAYVPSVRYGDPAWSPDGKQIAFTDDSNIARGDLYLMNAGGGDVQKLTSSSTGLFGASDPTWSPDSARIAFSYNANPAGEGIYAINRDGSTLQRLTPSRIVARSPDWSHSGRRIAFTDESALEFGGSSQIWVINPDGKSRELVARPSADASYESPTWSPDGERMAFTVRPAPTGSEGYRGGDALPIFLGIVHRYRGKVAPYTPGGFTLDPDWSPDGRKIIFSDGTRIRVLTLKTRKTVTLRAGEHPRWSPNGKRVVYSYNGTIRVMNADGSRSSLLYPR